MSDYEKNLQEETEYLEKTLGFISSELQRQTSLLSERKTSLKSTARDMWENSVHFSNDFDKLTEVNQYLSEVTMHTASYKSTETQIAKYKRVLGSPYFGRFDFVEEGFNGEEKIYLGLHNLMDPKTHEIYVYDWRAPISSIFYRYELGKAFYKAPSGDISGDVLLKRQYKVEYSSLKYFFDCNIVIGDEILQKVLSRNASPKMKNIVETIQREQDIIIRDTENELLIVQGVAGSGKTSIALHRIAFLLYHGLSSNLSYKNVLIVSPNDVFSNYISSVLPELGEENVSQITFDEYSQGALKNKGKIETRALYLESLINSNNTKEINLKMKSNEFKGSKEFIKILDRFVTYFERHMIEFSDIYFAGELIFSKHLLKSSFLNNKINMPASQRLERIKSIIIDRISPLQKELLDKIEKIVEKTGGHEFEIKSFSRLLSKKVTKRFTNSIQKFTEIDYFRPYRLLFNNKDLFLRLSRGIDLPTDIWEIINYTSLNINNGFISYGDVAPLIYLKLKLKGSNRFKDIKQVLIDEAQDYTPMHYAVMNIIFKDAGYTILGDVNQSIEKDLDISLYDSVNEIFQKRKSIKLTLMKSFRSTKEICDFNNTLLGKSVDAESFERHGEIPSVVYMDTLFEIDNQIAQDIRSFFSEGYESIAVICKTLNESKDLFTRLSAYKDINLTDFEINEINKGVSVIPSYMAKGLEFDVALIYNVSDENYNTEFDRRLLYIACTRALHRLTLYYTGLKSEFI